MGNFTLIVWFPFYSLFDQLYQYGEAGEIRTGELKAEDYSEEEPPSLEELD